jgi:hypothetical protein
MLLLTRGAIFDGMCRVILNGVHDERQLLIETGTLRNFDLWKNLEFPANK